MLLKYFKTLFSKYIPLEEMESKFSQIYLHFTLNSWKHLKILTALKFEQKWITKNHKHRAMEKIVDCEKISFFKMNKQQFRRSDSLTVFMH